MTGPGHYRMAEHIMALIEELPAPEDGLTSTAALIVDSATSLATQAQVHATLALVAATIETAAARGPGDVPQVWIEVTS